MTETTSARRPHDALAERTKATATAIRSALRATVEREFPLATLQLDGRLNGDNVRALGSQLSELVRGGHRYVVVEMSGLAEIAPVSVGVLNRAIAELRQLEGTLTLRGVSIDAQRALQRAGLHPAILLTA